MKKIPGLQNVDEGVEEEEVSTKLMTNLGGLSFARRAKMTTA